MQVSTVDANVKEIRKKNTHHLGMVLKRYSWWVAGTFFCGFAPCMNPCLDAREMQGMTDPWIKINGESMDLVNIPDQSPMHPSWIFWCHIIGFLLLLMLWRNFSPVCTKPTEKQRLSWIPFTFKALVPPDLAGHAAARGQCRIGRRTSPEFWVELRGCKNKWWVFPCYSC